MISVRILGFLLGLLLIAGELARWWGNAMGLPKALDDVIAGAILLLLAVLGGRIAPALHVAGWALFTGVMLTTLVINLDAWMWDAGKARAGLYAAALSLLSAVGAIVTLWWARRAGGK
ncbi:hypothetical protein [Sandaracinobacteroides saxicola]|uniref:Uncharacterized protein n=1 Tax=Sandaracinobacteroides saxicola TaxID=2759707 RepID=A0A7G5IHW1_9SPHN|nr:hypothetical protein [Sandaracinobacteroides saxicola]QMW22953.1 hypothetical protein H3309_00085 [Sandaracinobacteroides saxicola]